MFDGFVCLCCVCIFVFFFVKQKTAYEMRISDWSSDVCSSDLVEHRPARVALVDGGVGLDEVVVAAGIDVAGAGRDDAGGHRAAEAEGIADGDRKSGV